MRKWILFLMALWLTTLTLTACGGGRAEPTATPVPPTATPEPVAQGDPAKGKELFAQTCAACHGPTGEGVQGLGKDMTQSEFIASLSDAELLDFIKKGRAPDDPLNTTGVLMPPKGGNPALTDEQLMDIIAYIRTIHR
jgi:disulfide bond formation protein DsbB